jgi:NAD-dependent SIR2 family protein deacetylase
MFRRSKNMRDELKPDQPDITFFGQALDSEFDRCLHEDREKVDLLVIMGTSLKVAPVSEVLCASWLLASARRETPC